MVPIMGRPARTAADRKMMAEIGQRFKWVREALGLSQAEIAEIVGLDQTAWSQYERGGRFPDYFRLPDLCKKLQISMDYLLEGDLDGVERRLAIALASQHPELANHRQVKLTGADQEIERAWNVR